MLSKSSLFRTITGRRIVIILAMVAVLGLITYYSSLPPTLGPITDSQTGNHLVLPTTGDDTLSSGSIATGVNNNTGTFTVYPAKYFVETHEDNGSCMVVRIEDDKGKTVDMPAEIDDTLDCIGGGEVFSHSYRFLLYTIATGSSGQYIDLKTYDFSNKKIQTLMSFNNTIDGMSCQRRDDDSYIACVVINQKEYTGLTKIFVLQVGQNGSLVRKQVFPQTKTTNVGFHCGSSCYPSDFRWEGTRILQYEGQDNGDDILTGKTYSIQYD